MPELGEASVAWASTAIVPVLSNWLEVAADVGAWVSILIVKVWVVSVLPALSVE